MLDAITDGYESDRLDLLVVFMFLRNKMRRPCDKIGGALVMSSQQGSGKNSLVAPVMDSLRPHSYEAQGSDEFASHFNIHTTGKLLIHVNEAGDSHNRKGGPRWKGFITETEHNATAKHKDTQTGIINFADVIVSSNERDPVPAQGADGGDRRFYQLLLPPKGDQPTNAKLFRGKMGDIRKRAVADGYGDEAKKEWRQYCADVCALLMSDELPQLVADRFAELGLEKEKAETYLPDFWAEAQLERGMSEANMELRMRNARFQEGAVAVFLHQELTNGDAKYPVQVRTSKDSERTNHVAFKFRPACWRKREADDVPRGMVPVAECFDDDQFTTDTELATLFREEFHKRYHAADGFGGRDANNVFFQRVGKVLKGHWPKSGKLNFPTLEVCWYLLAQEFGFGKPGYEMFAKEWRGENDTRKAADVRLATWEQMDDQLSVKARKDRRTRKAEAEKTRKEKEGNQ